jgi:flagellar hook-associated protein 1 FlgK
MGMDAALSVAIGGLANINRDLAVVSQNVSNANTPGYVREIASQHELSVGGQGMGVVSGPATRALDVQQQADLFTQNATVSGLDVRQNALASIDQMMGTPGAANDLASLLGKIEDGFSALLASPDNQSGQAQIISAAQGFAGKVNSISTAVGTARTQAQSAIMSDVTSLNAVVATVGVQTQQIMTARAAGISTADLENQRDVGLAQISGLIDARFLVQNNGDIKAITPSGLSINFTPGVTSFATQSATMAPSVFYPGGGVPAITMNGVDVTSQFAGRGSLGGNIDVRDNIMPGLQAGLDEVAQTISTRFQAQGLTLFTQPDGTVPAGGGVPVQSTYLGYARAINVNPAVIATPSLVRDGTNAIVGLVGGASAFTPNPAGGPAGFAALISRVIQFALGAQAQAGVAQTAANTNGLGPQGNLVGPFGAGGSMGTMTGALVASEAQLSNAVSANAATEQAVQTSLQARLAQGGSVNIDSELSTMVQLQNAYGANARVISALQAMWTQLLQSVN